MSFLDSFIFVLTLLSTIAVSVAQEATSYNVRASFELQSDVLLNPEAKLLADESLKLSFGRTFEPSDELAIKATVKSMLRVHVVKASEQSTTFTTVGDWSPQVNCSRCHVSDSTLLTSTYKADHHDVWQADFCKTLQDGPFDTVRNCQIVARQVDTPGSAGVVTKALQQHAADDGTTSGTAPLYFTFNVIASFGLQSEQEILAAEQHFLDECLRESYNDIHKKVGAVVQSASLINHFRVPNDGLTVGKYIPHHNQLIDTHIFNWSVTGLCAFCGSTLNGMEGSSLENGTNHIMTLQRSKMEQTHWEETFCDKLISGSFEKFQPIERCYIEIYNPNERAGAE